MNVYNESGENVGKVELASEIMETPINRDVLHQVVVMHLANKRSGTASTKGRSEVSGTGRKLYRQKGTGMARAGSRRSPLRIGGGVEVDLSEPLAVRPSIAYERLDDSDDFIAGIGLSLWLNESLFGSLSASYGFDEGDVTYIVGLGFGF